MNLSSSIKNTVGGGLTTLLIGLTGSAQGATDLNLSNTPLFLGDSVNPNVYVEMDDSGSMDWDVLTGKHWHYCAYDSNALGSTGDSDCGFLVDNGLLRLYARTAAGDGNSWEYFEYLLDSSDDAYTTGCTRDWATAMEHCGDATNNADWRARAAALNVMYYNPAVVYEPWAGGLVDGDFSAARSNPQPGTDGYDDLRDLGAGDGFTYHVWQDTKGYSGTRPRRGDYHNDTDGPNDEVDLWDDHVEFNVSNTLGVRYRKITYNPNDGGMNPTVSGWVTMGSSDIDEFGGLTPDEIRQNIANWYQYGRRRSFVAKAATGRVVEKLPGFRWGISVINDPDRLTVDMPAIDADHFVHNEGLLNSLYSYEWQAQGTPLRQGLERVGEYYKTTGSDAPIIHACQQNFSILFTDGYWNGGNPVGAINDADGDSLSETLADVAYYYYENDLRGDLADEVTTNDRDLAEHQHMVTFTVAFGVQGNLVDTNGDTWPDKDAAGADYVPEIDGDWGNPLPDDHNTEKVDDLWHAAFNSKGEFISAKTPQEVVRAQERALSIIKDMTSSAASVALNSGSLGDDTHVFQARFFSGNWSGQLLSYKINPDGSIATEPTWDAGKKLDGQAPGSRVILTLRPTDDLDDGTAGTGIPFRFPANYQDPGGTELSDLQLQALMQTAPYDFATTDSGERSENQGYGQALLGYLRGERTHEGDADPAGYKFRERGSALGDVIHSDPVYVGPPNLRYPDYWRDLLDPETDQPENAGTSYSAFRSTYSTRLPLIYFGANDGMLHGINATDVDDLADTTDKSEGGAELLAYVPTKVYSRLRELSDVDYLHKYFVNGPPTVVDAFYEGAWHTVLVGGLAGGGQGIYALDVTNPSDFSEDKASDLVMWEFTDLDSAELGYTYARPAVVRLHNGKWGVILGNGYNSTRDDGVASTTGNAVLFILDVSNGNILKAIDTGVGSDDDPADTDRPNGLATAAPIDLDRDGIVDYVYAGDLYGNMWKFDITDIDPAKWDIAKFASSDGTVSKQPLIKAVQGDESLPITSKPEVGVAPFGQAGVMVYFGTGQYLEVGDNTPLDQVTQTFYGVWDTGVVVTRDELQEQQILQEEKQAFYDEDGVLVDTFDLRVTSDTAVSWRSEINTDGDLGWYMDLINQEDGDDADNMGERQISNSILRNDRIIFTTLLPSQNPCDYGGSSWLMELDAFSGARLPYSPFDLNLDGSFGEEDYVCTADCDDPDKKVSVAASGKKSKVGIIPTPGILSSASGGSSSSGSDDDEKKKKVNPCEEGAECKLASGSTGNHEETRENPGKGDFGRQSWQEL